MSRTVKRQKLDPKSPLCEDCQALDFATISKRPYEGFRTPEKASSNARIN
jgi:hypothetical protein